MEITDAIFGGGTPNYGKLAAQSEKKRQGIIGLGLNQINAVYGGGTAPFYSPADNQRMSKTAWSAYGKNQPLYQLNKQGEFSPFYAPKPPRQADGLDSALMHVPVLSATGSLADSIKTGDYSGGLKNAAINIGTGGMFDSIKSLFGSDTPTPREIVNKQLRKGQLFNAPEYKTFKGYGKEFYDAREKAYTDSALPQLADQYQDARKNTVYGLSNVGLSGSSVGDEANYKLEKAMNSGKQTVADNAIGQSNALRQQVESSRQAAINQLYQTGDPSQALKTAIGSASQFENPGGFAPLANGFGDVMNQFYINKLLSAYSGGKPAGVGETNTSNYFAKV